MKTREHEENYNSTDELKREKTDIELEIKELKAKSRMGKLGKTIMAFAFLGLVAIGVMVTWHLINPTSDETKIDVTVLKEELVKIQEVSTAKYTYTDMQTFKNTRKLPLINVSVPLTTKMVRIKYSGEVKAFFDMKKCEIKNSKNKITVKLPKIQLSHSMDDKIVEEHNNIFNPISMDEQSKLVKSLKTIMEDRAIKKGLMDEARDNSKKMIKGILLPAVSDGKEIKVFQSKKALSEDKKTEKKISKKAKEIKKNLNSLDESDD